MSLSLRQSLAAILGTDLFEYIRYVAAKAGPITFPTGACDSAEQHSHSNSIERKF